MIELTEKNSLTQMLKNKELFDMNGAAKITGYCARYLRVLCHAQKISHQKILGRYYMTPEDIAAIIKSVKVNP